MLPFSTWKTSCATAQTYLACLHPLVCHIILQTGVFSSKQSLKGVLLHNGNKYPSIPIAHSVHLKESYDNMKLLWEAIKYSEYQWSLCGDLKVIGLLMGMQAGFTKYCCFLCLWDSRAVSQHYKQKDWRSRSTFVPGEHSLKENPLVDMNKVLLPPRHIKLGLMKNFMKALHKNGAAFQHLSTVFPGLSTAKLKEGIFVGPQIREVLKDTGEAFKSVCSGFLGNTRVPDYQACIEKLLKSYEDMGCRMSLKIHFLHSRQTLEQRVMSMEKNSTKTLRRWRATIKANGTPAWWETSTGCSCVTSRRQNTPDLLRKHTFDCLWYYELCNCVIQVYWFNQCSFIYPVLSVISCCNSWNMHIYSLFILKWDYLKARKLEVIEQNYKFEFSTPKLTKNTYPHSCLRPKIYFYKPVLLYTWMKITLWAEF